VFGSRFPLPRRLLPSRELHAQPFDDGVDTIAAEILAMEVGEVVVGGTNILVRRGEEAELLQIVAVEKVTSAFLMPPTIVRILELKAEARRDVSSVRPGLFTPVWGDPLPADNRLWATAHRWLRADISDRFGRTHFVGRRWHRQLWSALTADPGANCRCRRQRSSGWHAGTIEFMGAHSPA
jgi:acyl-coenzyme A synthetase/AMP-(fatty) acid ligase